MNLVNLEQKLIAAARARKPDERVPLAFEKRITALLTARPVLDQWALWSRALWRGALGCLAVVLVLGAVSVFLPQGGGGNDLAQDFENTMLASADQDNDSSSW
jgi:hypothetical protein